MVSDDWTKLTLWLRSLVRSRCRVLSTVLCDTPQMSATELERLVARENLRMRFTYAFKHPVRAASRYGRYIRKDPRVVYKALSGYVPLPGGGAIEFSLLLNGETITNKTSYRPTWELLASVLAAYPSGPTPEALAPR